MFAEPCRCTAWADTLQSSMGKVVSALLTLEEKKYILRLLKKEKTSIFKKVPVQNKQLIEKLEQMIRNEEVNELNR